MVVVRPIYKAAIMASSCFLLVTTFACFLVQPTVAFSPVLRRTASFSSTKLFSSPMPSTNGLTSANNDDESKQKGIEALQRLLKRQEAEMEETKRLMKLYEAADGSSMNATLYSENDDFMSVASSLMKGFDYGFVSRSEGASFKNLKGGNEAFVGYGPPANVWKLGTQQFMRNLKAMREEYDDEPDVGKLHSCVLTSFQYF